MPIYMPIHRHRRRDRLASPSTRARARALSLSLSHTHTQEDKERLTRAHTTTPAQNAVSRARACTHARIYARARAHTQTHTPEASTPLPAFSQRYSHLMAAVTGRNSRKVKFPLRRAMCVYVCACAVIVSCVASVAILKIHSCSDFR